MAALLSLLIGTGLGLVLWQTLAPASVSAVRIPAAFIVGQTLQATIIYFAAYGLQVSGAAAALGVHPLLPANIAVHVLSLMIIVGFWIRYRRAQAKKAAKEPWPAVYVDLKAQRRRRIVIPAIAGSIIVAYLLTRYTFYLEDGNLLAGVSVFSDFAPHTAVMRSFSAGLNFPTAYPHFAGDGIAYHFFFYFLAGNLNYLGLPLDRAMNLPSVLAMLAFVHLLGTLAVKLTRRRHAYWLSPLLVAFRSSFSVWTWLNAIRAQTPEAMQIYPELGFMEGGSGPGFAEAWRLMWSGTRFAGTLPRDDWGLFASNVYANQRHFVWGICLLLIVVILWLPSLQAGLQLTEKEGWKGAAKGFARKEMWNSLPWKPLLLSVLILLPFPYWHGSTLIVLLMVLFVMALRSRDKGAYIVMALVALASSLALTSFFAGEAAAGIEPAFRWGFLLGEEAGFREVLVYLMTLFGLAFPLMLILPWQQKTAEGRTLAAAGLFPLIFAMTVSLTADITVNHKFLMLAYILLTPALAGFLLDLVHGGLRKIRQSNMSRLDSRRRAAQGALSLGLALLLGSLMTVNGVVDLKVYLNKNEQKVGLQTDSALVEWLQANTDPRDIFITPPWSYHAFFYSGRQSNYGHSYYAWSAGHNTEERLDEQNRWLSGDLPAEVWTQEARARHVRYLIVNDEFRHTTDAAMQPPVHTEGLEEVAAFPEEGNMVIYRLY